MHARSLLLSLVALSSLLAAQNPTDASGSKLEVARKAWTEFKKVQDDVAAETKKLAEEMRGMPREGATEEQKAKGKAVLAKMSAARARLEGPRKTFASAFAACPIASYDVQGDGALLKEGLPALAADLEAPDKAVAAGRLFLDHFGDERAADRIRTNTLPMALVAAGKTGDAVAMLEQAANAAEKAQQAQILLTLGDIEAATGHPEAAQKRYAALMGWI